MRHSPGEEPDVRAYAVTHPSGTVVIPQPPGWDQLLYASRGVMSVHTRTGTWVVPPHRAVWVPSGTDHSIVMSGRVSVRTLYFAAGLATLPQECRAVNVPALLRELILHAAERSPLYRRIAAHERLIGVILDQLAALPTAPLQLPVPRDPRALRVASALMENPAGPQSLAALARAAGIGVRTVQRQFLAETGMTLDEWRRRSRLVEALRLLASGERVTAVALAVGYSTPSAFAAMFRRETGVSPGRYFAAGGSRT